MTTTELTATTTQVYQLFIRATPEAIWEAITAPEFTERYFYGVRIETSSERRITHAYDGSDTYGEDPVFEWDPPRRLVHGWHSKWNPELSAEKPSRVSWEIDPRDDDTCLLTVVHDQLEGAPKTAESVSGPGWMMVLSGLKTLLETGEPLT
jgi:uncharacterized protein YndB with AHSA1/START domain